MNLQVNQRVGGNWQSGAQQSATAITATLAGLSPADFLAGVELEIETVATTANNALTALLPLTAPWLAGGLVPLPGTRGVRRVYSPSTSPEPSQGLLFNSPASGQTGQRLYFHSEVLSESALASWVKRNAPVPGAPDDYWLLSGRPDLDTYAVTNGTKDVRYFAEGVAYQQTQFGTPRGLWRRVVLNLGPTTGGLLTLLGPAPSGTGTGYLNTELYDVRYYGRHFTIQALADRTAAPVDSLLGRWELGPTTDTSQPAPDLSGNNLAFFFGF